MTRHSVRRLASDASVADRLAQRRAIDANGCWTYNAAHCQDGYAVITINGRTDGVHRVAYREFVGPIAPGLQIDHLCRNRACFNPEHLEAVTRQENNRRRGGRNAKAAA